MKKSNLLNLCKKIHIIFIVIQFTLINFIFCQVPDFIWAKNSTGTGADELVKAVTDENGDIYIMGNFHGQITFGSYQLLSNGNSTDFFIVKYNSIGDVDWAKSFGGIGSDEVSDGIVDYQGNLYIIGSFDSPQLIAGNTSLTPYKSDLLFIKFDKSGSVLWSRNFGGDSDEYGLSISRLSNGNIIITGNYYGTIMNIGNLLTSPNCSLTTNFCAELEADADIVDAFNVQECSDFKLISTGRPLSCSYYLMGSDYWTGTFFLHEYGCGALPNKNLVKIVTSSDGFSTADHCVIDYQGNIYITGYFNCKTLTISGKGSSKFVELSGPSTTGVDFYIAKISYDFKLLWAKSYGSNSSDFITDCRVNGDGKLYITGMFQGNSLFDGPNKLINSNSGQPLFITELDNNGNVNWAKSNNSGIIALPKFSIDNGKNLCVAGMYHGECSFGNINIEAAKNGIYKYFVCKLGILSSVDNFSSKDLFKLAPNPNKGTFQLNFTQSIQYNKIELINFNGQVIWHDGLKEIVNQKIIELPSEIQSGMYLLKLSINNRDHEFRKVVINR